MTPIAALNVLLVEATADAVKIHAAALADGVVDTERVDMSRRVVLHIVENMGYMTHDPTNNVVDIFYAMCSPWALMPALVPWADRLVELMAMP